MPLPLLVPIGLGLTALATGAYGAKKGYDAYKDNSKANELNEEASDTYEKAQKLLNSAREETNLKMESLVNKIDKNSGEKICIGDTIQIEVLSADVASGEIDFAPIS